MKNKNKMIGFISLFVGFILLLVYLIDYFFASNSLSSRITIFGLLFLVIGAVLISNSRKITSG